MPTSRVDSMTIVVLVVTWPIFMVVHHGMIEKIMKRSPNDYDDTEPLTAQSVGCGSHPNTEQSYNKLDGRVASQMSRYWNSIGQI